MTSPVFGRKEARELALRRARRAVAIRHAIAAAALGLALLIAAAGVFFVSKSGLWAWLAICSIGSFYMVALILGDVE